MSALKELNWAIDNFLMSGGHDPNGRPNSTMRFVVWLPVLENNEIVAEIDSLPTIPNPFRPLSGGYFYRGFELGVHHHANKIVVSDNHFNHAHYISSPLAAQMQQLGQQSPLALAPVAIPGQLLNFPNGAQIAFDPGIEPILRGTDEPLFRLPLCECGSEKVGGTTHSTWCPKHD